MERLKRNGFISSLFIIMFLALTVCAFAASNDKPQFSPVNPDYLKYLDQAKQGKRFALTSDEHPTGLVPGPQLPPSFKGYSKAIVSAASLPSSYDLRKQGKLTDVRDQGICGSCWAFATYSSLESYLKPAETADFSEQHLIDTHGFDLAPCVGGNVDMSVAYLSRWDGPIYESSDPYIYALQNAEAPKKHVQNVVYLPNRTSESDNTTIKQAVMDYGAIFTSFYYGNSYFNSEFKSYYYFGGSTPPNHGVAIVGWDDDFDKNNFNTPAPGNGAFIFRNSWGSGWGENGYGYVSYYDSIFARTYFNAAFTAEEPTRYSGVYQYDPLGYVIAYYAGSPATGWGANIFTASGSDPITAVGFYALSTNTAYQLYVYTGVSGDNPVSGTLQASTSGTIALPGFYTIALPSLVSVSPGQNFSVVIKLITPGFDWPVAIEMKYPGYSSNATSSPGQSFLSNDGSSWSDFFTAWPSDFVNVCLKAYTVGTGTIHGTVYQQNGTAPITGESVRIEAHPADPCNSGSTAWADSSVSDGTYTITGLPEGTWYAQAGRNSNYYSEWYEANGGDCLSAVPIVLTGNTSATDISFSLMPFKKGDINADRNVDLTDAILGLKVVSGMSPVGIVLNGDVNGDRKIGIEDVLFILQMLGGIR